MASYLGFMTAQALLRPYRSLALNHRKAKESEKLSADLFKRPEHPAVDIGNTAALLTLNASILEGTLRLLLSEHLWQERERAVIEGKKAGRTVPTKGETFLAKFQNELELEGGWSRLANQYTAFFSVSLDAVMSEKDKTLTEAINSLFVLRNVFAHGTALIQPTEKMDDTQKDDYPYDWQRKLQRAAVYLKSQFKGEDVFELLAQDGVPEHFWKRGVEMLEIVIHAIGTQEQSSKLLEEFRQFGFGYR